MTHGLRYRLTIALLVVCLALMVGVTYVFRTPHAVTEYTEMAADPNISPDYSDLVLPANIAPVNFRILEPGQQYSVKIHSAEGTSITVFSKTGRIRIPRKKWHALLTSSRGRDILFDVFVKGADQTWTKFRPVTNRIAREPIDSTVVYRRMKPIYNWWKGIGVYQRSLADFDESPVLHGKSFDEGCVNCHSFAGQAPDMLTLGLRSAKHGSDTLLARNGEVRKIGAKWGYTAWHPSATLAVYSLNKVRQFFHTGRMEVRDVVDLDSALACYSVQDNKTTCPPQLSDKSRLETYPAWSPDGKTLYFCSAPMLWEDEDSVPPPGYETLKYDLCRVTFDIETGQWGEVETVLSARETGLSILLPRISPDGKFLLFCMCQYGCFPVYQASSDLYMMELSTGQYRKLAVNSPYSESWHSWSSNSRWVAFSSKCQDGRFTRTYLSYIDDEGKASKPFVLPQKDPRHYDCSLDTYTVPELITGRIAVPKASLGRSARRQAGVAQTIPITGATPRIKTARSWQERE